MLSVTTNTASTIAQLALTKTRKGFGVALERLSTGQTSWTAGERRVALSSTLTAVPFAILFAF